jgi:dTDP-glucose 4,6-dehydratase
MYSDDLVKWLLKILNSSSQDCPIYNVGSSDAISIDRLAILLGKKYNLTVNLKNKINYKKVDRFLPNIQKAKKRLNLKNKFSSFNAIIKTINLLNKEL